MSHKTKLFLYPILYWIVLIIIPFISTGFIKCCDYYASGTILYILIVSPFLFFIPYLLSKPQHKKEKLWFLLLGLIIPFLVIYIYIFVDFQKSFNPSF